MEATFGSSEAAAVRETHTAVVLLMGDRAYKVKKPVDLGFLDFRTREARRAACHREVALNRRMAPDVYLGVADVLDLAGAPCEHVVVMRRMPDERRLATLVRAGQDVRPDLRRLARDLAAFHAAAATGPEVAACGGPEALLGRWRANLAGLRRLRPVEVPAAVVDRVEQLAVRYVAGRGPLLAARMAAGLVRDGHGDLLADDVFCLPDGPRALDCLEFDDRLRWMDVLDDVACLAMDLERLGAPAAAGALLAAYAEFSGVPQPASLRQHYLAYRAVMRAKVAAIRAASSTGPAAAAAREQAGLLCRLGLAHLRRGRVRLVLVGGPPATGKSTVAEAVADARPAAVLSSDRVRKELHGLAPDRPAPAAFAEGIYTEAATRRTYEELARRAERLLRLGQSVVVDASFTRERERRLFRAIAEEACADLDELRCTAPAAVLRDRLRARTRRPDGASDAGPEVGERLAAAADPWPGADVIDTAGPVSGAAAAALRALSRR